MKLRNEILLRNNKFQAADTKADIRLFQSWANDEHKQFFGTFFTFELVVHL